MILKLKVTKKNFLLKSNYDLLYVGNVHKSSLLKDKKILRLKISKMTPIFEKNDQFLKKNDLLRTKVPILF